MSRILIADDQHDVLVALRLLLKGAGYELDAVSSPRDLLAALKQREYGLVLMDLNYARDTTSGEEGLKTIPLIQQSDPTVPIVVMTAWSTVDVAVEAMKRGARDFVPKPWDNERLLNVVRAQMEFGNALRSSRKLEVREQTSNAAVPKLIAKSPQMRSVRDLIGRVAPSDANVLIIGENGTGKGVVARALHALSPRSGKPLVTVNVGGLSKSLFESELFGHVKGAFTDAKSDRAGRFELAHESTLFLDEIANIPLDQQATLLRVIESGEFERLGSSKPVRTNARIIAATNANLREEVAAGRFRQDLLFRLNTIEIALAPLRERREDIEPLATNFLRQHARRYRKSVGGLDPAALEALQRYAFPGNIRELDHIIERAVLMAQDALVKPRDLGLGSGQDELLRIEEMRLEEVESFLIKKALTRFDGNARRAAEALGLSRSTFYRRMQQYDLKEARR